MIRVGSRGGGDANFGLSVLRLRALEPTEESIQRRSFPQRFGIVCFFEPLRHPAAFKLVRKRFETDHRNAKKLPNSADKWIGGNSGGRHQQRVAANGLGADGSDRIKPIGFLVQFLAEPRTGYVYPMRNRLK